MRLIACTELVAGDVFQRADQAGDVITMTLVRLAGAQLARIAVTKRGPRSDHIRPERCRVFPRMLVSPTPTRYGTSTQESMSA